MASHQLSRLDRQSRWSGEDARAEDDDTHTSAGHGDEDVPLTTWKYSNDGESASSDESDGGSSFESFTREEEQRVVKKLDRRLVLFVALLYLFSFLDRSSES